MIGLTITVAIYGYFAFRYYVDFYIYDRSTLDGRILVPSLLFFLYALFLCIYGPGDLMDELNDEGIRSTGLYTQILPLYGLIAASYPYQVSELNRNYISITATKANMVYRVIGWGMVVVALVRNLIFLT